MSPIAIPGHLRSTAFIIATLAIPGLVAAQPVGNPRFQLQPPGATATGSGARDYVRYAPGMLFPISKDFPATANSQVYSPGGKHGGPGGQCHASNYDEEWQDTLCEKRGAQTQPLGCPTNRSHKGVDLRGGTAATCRRIVDGEKKVIPVVAVADGQLSTGTYSVTLRMADGQKFVYLHLDMDNLQLPPDRRVAKGDVIGYMDNDFGGTSTTFHLHIEHWMNIPGRGIIPVPIYCDLAAAYASLHGKDYDVTDGSQRCDGTASTPITPASEPPPLPIDKLVSYWDHNGSEVALLAEGDRRNFVYVKPRPGLDGLVEPGDVLFNGRKRDNDYVGRARIFSRTCEPADFDVQGPILTGGLTVEVRGDAPERTGACTISGSIPQRLTFNFVRQKDEAPVQTCGIDRLDRQSLTERTKNWGAITMFVPFNQWLPYVRNWPGLRLDENGRPVNLGLDKNGGFIPALETDESGVGMWWYWLLVRKGYGDAGEPTKMPSLREIARGIAGDRTSPSAVSVYSNAYQVHGTRYFGRTIGLDDPIDLNDAVQRWALGQTMFHHEAARAPLITRATFDRGISFGTDYMKNSFRGVDGYLPPCEDEASDTIVAEPETPVGEADETLLARVERLERRQVELEAEAANAVRTSTQLSELVTDLRSRLTSIATIAQE